MCKNTTIDLTSINPDIVIESSREFMMLSGKSCKVAYVSGTATILKVPEDIDRIIGFCAVPRSFAAIEKYMKIDTEGNPTKDEFHACIKKLLRSGILDTRDINIDRREARWVKVDFNNKAPKNAAIHLTFNCNLKCDYCYNESIRKEQLSRTNEELTFQQWDAIISDLVNSGVKQFDITGGEPLLRIDIFPILEAAKDSGIDIHLITNGLLINEDNIEIIARSVSQVSVSFDSYNEEEHDKHRGQGTHKKVISSIKLLKDRNISWGSMMVYNKDTLSSFWQTREFTRSLGAKYHNASIQSYPRIEEDVKRVFAAIELEEVAVYSGGDFVCGESTTDSVERERTMNVGPFYHCSAARNECAIDPYGHLYPCRLLMIDEFDGGDLSKNKFMDVWLNSKNLDKVRYFDPTTINKCADCDFLLHCLGGCRGLAVMSSGQLNGTISEENCNHMKQLSVARILNAIGEL